MTAESDWLRLLMAARYAGGLGEFYSETLALPPHGSIDFDMTITPVTDGGGYWSFINSVRKRWGVNGTPAERPMFWGWYRAPDIDDAEERYQKWLDAALRRCRSCPGHQLPEAARGRATLARRLSRSRPRRLPQV